MTDRLRYVLALLGAAALTVGVQTRDVEIDPRSPSVERRRKASVYHGHGYLPDHPSMRPLLVFAGAGIVSGRSLGRVRNIDVAPRIATLLGLSLSDVDGRVLREALK